MTGRLTSEIIWKSLPFFGVIVLTLPALGAWPILDANIYGGCLFHSLNRPFSLNNYICYHPTTAFFFILSLPQYWIGPSHQLLSISLLVLALLAVRSFYVLTEPIAKLSVHPDISPVVTRSLLTCLFSFSPLFLSNILFVNPDFGVLVFLLVFLAQLYRKHFILATLAAIGLTFSKEIGVVIYLAILCFLSLLFFVTETRRRLWCKRGAIQIIMLILPLIMLLLNFSFGTFGGMGQWLDPAHNAGQGFRRRLLLGNVIFRINPFERFNFEFLGFITILNYNWILTTLIAIATIVFIAKNFILKRGIQLQGHGFQLSFVLFLLIVSVYACTRETGHVNPRYINAVLPFFYLTAAYSLHFLIVNRRLLHLVVTVILILFVCSAYSTSDPISKTTFGTFQFGKKEILATGFVYRGPPPQKTLPPQGLHDSLVYNFEYVNFCLLSQYILTEERPVNDDVVFWGHLNLFLGSYLRFEATSFKLLTLPSRNDNYVSFFSTGSLKNIQLAETLKQKDSGTLIFMDFPNAPSTEERQFVTQHYKEERRREYCINGYCAEVTRYSKVPVM